MLDPSTAIGQLFGPSCTNIRDQLDRLQAHDLTPEVRAALMRLSAQFMAFEQGLATVGLDLPMHRTSDVLHGIASALGALAKTLPKPPPF